MNTLLLQTDITWEDKASNHQRVDRLVREAKPAPDTLVVLPEMFATGFSMDVARIHDTETHETERFLASLARELGIAFVAGVVARDPGGRGRNQSLFIQPDGTTGARYTKMQPFSLGGETSEFVAGEGPLVFEWQGLKVAPFVCYDLRFPELFRAAVDLGAEAFIVIANWPVTRIQHWTTLLRARAIENQAYAVGVNRVGTDPRYQYNGRSLAVDPWGETIVESADREQACLASLDPDRVRAWRRDFPALRDRRPAGGAR